MMFAELLVIGAEVMAWLFLLLLNILGYSWLQGISAKVADWQNTLALLFLLACYTLGVLFDRVADFLFVPWDHRIRDKIIPTPPLKSIAVMRFEAGKDNEYLNRQFEYTRTRMRIARASTINLGLITVLGLLFIWLRLPVTVQINKAALSITVIAVGVLLTSLAAFALRQLTRTYFRMVKSTYERLHSKSNATSPAVKKAG